MKARVLMELKAVWSYLVHESPGVDGAEGRLVFYQLHLAVGALRRDRDRQILPHRYTTYSTGLTRAFIIYHCAIIILWEEAILCLITQTK